MPPMQYKSPVNKDAFPWEGVKFYEHDRLGRPHAPYAGTPRPRPGVWTRAEQPVMCESGWHFSRAKDLASWAEDEAWAIETRGVVLDAADKACAESVRLVRRLRWSRKDAAAIIMAVHDILILNGAPHSHWRMGELRRRATAMATAMATVMATAMATVMGMATAMAMGMVPTSDLIVCYVTGDWPTFSKVLREIVKVAKASWLK